MGINTKEFAVTFQKLNANGTISGIVLDKDYLARDNITIYRDGLYVGFAWTSLSFIGDTDNYNAHIHEFLHHTKNNRYRDVLGGTTPPYSDNIMRFALPIGSGLRYRQLQHQYNRDSTSSQWEQIRRN